MAEHHEWLEISLVVNGELAEAVSDVLTRYISNGVVIENAVSTDPSGEQHIDLIGSRICGYLLIDESLEEKRSEIEQALWHLGTIQPLPEIKYQIIQDQNWMDKWKEHYHPIIIGEKLLILPPWLDNPYPLRIPIRIDPNMAFGTGTHPTTQLCLLLIENYLSQGMDVIDIGCGSGILSIACRLLGAPHVLAVDIDSLAVQATRENAALNGLSSGIECGLGSVTDIRGKTYLLKQANIVISNILAPVIIKLMEEGMGELVKPRGQMILSGILDHQVGEVTKTMVDNHFTILDSKHIDDWVALVFNKSLSPNSSKSGMLL